MCLRKPALAGVFAAVLFVLPGCATDNARAEVRSKVSAAVVTLTTAERLALIYTSQPRCPAPVPCSDPVLVQRIKDADNQAYAAVKAAERNEALLGVALTAIQNFQSVIPAK